jgi:hypothetical protein
MNAAMLRAGFDNKKSQSGAKTWYIIMSQSGTGFSGCRGRYQSGYWCGKDIYWTYRSLSKYISGYGYGIVSRQHTI